VRKRDRKGKPRSLHLKIVKGVKEKRKKAWGNDSRWFGKRPAQQQEQISKRITTPRKQRSIKTGYLFHKEQKKNLKNGPIAKKEEAQTISQTYGLKENKWAGTEKTIPCAEAGYEGEKQ